MFNVIEVFKVLLSKPFQDAVAAGIAVLDETDLTDEQKIDRLVDLADAEFEKYDEKAVALVPGAGPFLTLFADLPPVDAAEKQYLVRPVVETIYRGFKPKKPEALAEAKATLALP